MMMRREFKKGLVMMVMVSGFNYIALFVVLSRKKVMHPTFLEIRRKLDQVQHRGTLFFFC